MREKHPVSGKCAFGILSGGRRPRTPQITNSQPLEIQSYYSP